MNIAAAPKAPTTTFRLGWDDSRLQRTTAVWTTFSADSAGAKVVDAGIDQHLGRDRDLKSEDKVQQMIAQYFTNLVASKDADLRALTSNYAPGTPYRLGAGQFELVVDRPGNETDLHYVGLLDALPAPVKDLLAAAREVRDHL